MAHKDDIHHEGIRMIDSKCAPITVLIVSHNKPRLLPEAVESVLCQSAPHWQAILIDSGILYDQGYFARYPWAHDPRLHIVKSPETPALRRRKAMAPWCFNECLRNGWAHGDLIVYLCDDDLLYPNAFATFIEAFRRNPSAMAMYASQDIGLLGIDGRSDIVGERRALASGGKCCDGRIMDCQVDYLQLCHRRTALDAFPDTDYWPDDITTGDHADGLFMEKLGAFFEIIPIDIKVSQNRRTPWSVNVPSHSITSGFFEDAPIHESIVNTWATIRNHLESNPQDLALDKAVSEFQGQLRLLCEQDHAQRARLVSQRYRLADKLHALLSRIPNALLFWKLFSTFLSRLATNLKAASS